MALKPCPECGEEVSTKAESCPHCGYPLAQQRESNQQEDNIKNGKSQSVESSSEGTSLSGPITCLIVGLMPVFLLVGAVIVHNVFFENSESESTEASSSYEIVPGARWSEIQNELTTPKMTDTGETVIKLYITTEPTLEKQTLRPTTKHLYNKFEAKYEGLPEIEVHFLDKRLSNRRKLWVAKTSWNHKEGYELVEFRENIKKQIRAEIQERRERKKRIKRIKDRFRNMGEYKHYSGVEIDHGELCLYLESDKEEANEKYMFEVLIEENAIDPSNKKYIENDKFVVGMSECGLLAVLGEPRDINTTVTAYGKSKQYVYHRDLYVYFEDGKVTSWQR